MVIPRPDPASLRQPGLKWWINRMRFGTVFSLAIPIAGWFLWVRPLHKRHKDFLLNADPYWMMEHMCKRDLLQACPRNLQKMLDAE